MSSSTTNLDLISSSQASKEVTANALFDAESPAALYGRRASATANLTWGYYGGALNVNGVITAIPNGTKTLTNGATNYVEADPATGNVSVNTSNFTTANIPLYSVVTAGNVVTSYADMRVSLQHDRVPCFSAHLQLGTTQNITANTPTKVQLNVEEFDTANAFDSSTNYRFQPLVAGYYQISGAVSSTTASNTAVLAYIYKNGSSYKLGDITGMPISQGTSSVSALVFLNGSTDYVELWAYLNGTTPSVFGGGPNTYFNGCLIRKA